MPAASPWFLYLLECRGGSVYTGISTDVERRYAEHLAGRGARYTRAWPPQALLASIAFPDRASASRAEYRVKQWPAAQKRRFAVDTVAHAALVSACTEAPPQGGELGDGPLVEIEAGIEAEAVAEAAAGGKDRAGHVADAVGHGG